MFLEKEEMNYLIKLLKIEKKELQYINLSIFNLNNKLYFLIYQFFKY